MRLTNGPWMAAGVVALAGASIIAVTPSTPALPTVEVPAVHLTSGEDPITAWEDVFNTAFSDLQALGQDWQSDPFPVLQQIGDQISAGQFSADLPADLQAAGNALYEPDFADLDAAHTLALNGVIGTAVIPASMLSPDLLSFPFTPITYAFELLLGAAGPVVSPILAFGNSMQEIVTDLTGSSPDLTAAFDDLINIPAAVTGAFLNGYGDIDLTPLLSQISDFIPLSDYLPSLSTLTSLDVAMGGLLSPGESPFDALGFGLTFDPLLPHEIAGDPLELAAGSGVGFFGSLVDALQAIGTAIAGV